MGKLVRSGQKKVPHPFGCGTSVWVSFLLDHLVFAFYLDTQNVFSLDGEDKGGILLCVGSGRGDEHGFKCFFGGQGSVNEVFGAGLLDSTASSIGDLQVSLGGIFDALQNVGIADPAATFGSFLNRLTLTRFDSLPHRGEILVFGSDANNPRSNLLKRVSLEFCGRSREGLIDESGMGSLGAAHDL